MILVMALVAQWRVVSLMLALIALWSAWPRLARAARRVRNPLRHVWLIYIFSDDTANDIRARRFRAYRVARRPDSPYDVCEDRRHCSPVARCSCTPERFPAV